MKIVLTYFLLECKKSIKVLGKSVVSMMLMLMILIAGVAAVSYTLLQSPAFEKIKVAVVVPEDEKKVKLITQYISNVDSVKSVCEFEYMNQEVAQKELEEGNVQVMIEFPLNFYEDVYVGKNTPATIYFQKETTLGAEVFKGLLTSGVSFLQTSEAGVYAVLTVADGYSTQMPAGEVGDYVASLYVNAVLNRERSFEQFVVSSTGKVNYVQYYFSSVVLLLLLMSGLNYGYLYKENSRSVEQKLRIYGVGPWKMSAIKIVIMTGMLWLLGMLLYIAACIITARTGFELAYFRGSVIGGLFFLCLSIGAYFHAVYAIAGNSRQGTVLLLCMNLIMILCSGLLIPTAYFPESIQSLGAWMPVTFWNRYYTGLVFEEIYLKEILQTLALLFLGSGIGVTALWKDA